MDSSKPGKYVYDNYIFEYEPFYVGKGTGDRIKNTLYDKSPFKRNKINKLISNDIEIISLILVDNISNEESILIEKSLINLIGRRNLNEGTLVNMTDGGDGRLNSKHSKETIGKISNNRKGKGIGWKHKKETLKIMSDKQNGKNNGFYNHTHSDDTKSDQSKRVSGENHPMYNKKHSEETISLMKEKRMNLSNEKIKEACQKFNKPVLMYDLDLNFIREFESVRDTSVETGISESIISKCCRGDIIDPTRFFFKYKNPEDKIMNNSFLISIGDKFIFQNIEYKLIKRNTKTCIVESPDGENETIHVDEFKYLFWKSTNNSDLVELYLFIRNYDDSFKLKGNIITNGDIVINYIKLVDNCEIFNPNKRFMDNIEGIIVFEDEWVNKNEICKSRISYVLGKSHKIGARKCVIKTPDNKEVREFLVNNHLQGFVGSRVKLGLYHNDELVSLMTFGNLRKNMGQVAKEGSFELLRFCNKLNTSVMGGASKLFKYFKKEYNPSYILSYADRRWSDGNLYKELGFDESGKTIPNYFYIIESKREGRFKYRKDLLIKAGFDPEMTEIRIQHSRGYYRIFDKGSFKYEYNN